MMNSSRKEIKVPLDVQEDVIENIQQVFPHPVNKEIIRTILNNAAWDLEKGLNFLHDSLKSFSKGNSNSDQQFDWKQKNKPEKVVKDDKVNKSASPVRTPDPRKLELFKRSPKSKKPNSPVEGGDWVFVNNPELSNKSQNTEENNESSKKNSLKKRMIQNYDIIKLIGDTTLRISAYVKEGIKVIVLLRGCSGSGKSTYAKQFLEKEGAVNVESHLFSTDNFFIDCNGFYNFNQEKLQEAHEWNQRLVKLAAQEGRSPIFVDNTNTRLWEMKEYALIGIQFGYVLETLEPPTPWFFNEEVLYRKSRHSIPRERIRNMLDRYEANISGEDILKRLQLSYTHPFVPPQGTSAGLNTPMSKNHLKRLKDLNLRGEKSIPTPIPRSTASSIKQAVDNSQITTASNETSTFEYPYKEINTGNKTTSDFYNSNILETLDGLSLGSSSNQINRPKSLREANRKFESSCSDSEPEENRSYSEQEKIILESNSNNNLEYLLVYENNDILFQKDHVTMQGVKTLEDFRNVSEVKFPSCKNFDEFLAHDILGKEPATSLCVSDDPVVNSSCIAVKEQVSYSSNDHLQNVFPLIPKSSIDSSTTTTDIDFAILEKIGNGHEFLGQKIITGRPDFVSFKPLYSSRSLSSSVITDDKSTMIPDVLLLPDVNASTPSPVSSNELVNTLQSLFPQVGYGKLNELFGQSSWEDLNWAAGLLLDTGEQMVQSNEKYVNVESGMIMDKIVKAYPTENINSSSSKEIAGNLCDLLIPSTSSAPQQKLNNTTMANEKRNFIGDWDYKNEMPSELPVEKPKPQRDQKLNYAYKPNCSTTSTNTNYMDFEILKSANAGLQCEGVHILIGNPNFGSFARPLMTFPSSSVLMLDKGTMTTDVQTNQIDIGVRDSGIERLCLMFPKVCRVNLEELFDKCQRDIDWAVGLLLDSGQEMAELPTPLGTLNCSEAAEKQLPEVKNGEDIQSIEEKSKAQSKKKKKIRQSQSDSDVHKELQETIQKNFVFNEAYYSSEKMKKHFQRGDLKHNSKEDTNVSVKVEDEVIIEDEHSESDDVIFMLDSNFILQLQARFGGLLRSNMLAEKNVVSLPLNLARQLHSYVMDSVSQHIQEEDLFEDEDEDYARHLQEEEYKNRDAPSLLKIMDEEVALRKSQKNLNNGGSIASALSKKLLIERFPKMDPSTLAAILDDTNNSLHQASTLLEAAGHLQLEPMTETLVPLENEGQPLLSREEAIKQADAYGDVAGQLYELRKDCLRKSQKAYVTGNHSVASYYSDMAKWYMERIEKSNSLAAKAILSGYEGWTTIDLHFLHVSEALNILDLFIDEVIRVHKKSTVVYVITGRGIHSAGGRSRLKPAVKSRLTRRGLKFSEQNPGMLKVYIPRNALTSYKQDIEDPS